MVILRLPAIADLDAILNIQRASPEAAQWRAEDWRAYFAGEVIAAKKELSVGNCAWVAETDRETVGFLAGLFNGEEMEILNIAVAPSARRKGVATQMLKRVLEAAGISSGRKVFLEVRASNAGAIAFYERHGFARAGLRKDYYAAPVEDALVLARTLATRG